MRFRGQEYTGKGQLIAIVDSGVNLKDPRLAGVDVTGWSITMGATAHVLVAADFQDENGHGTEVAAAHPKGDRAYPADLPETVGVASHPDCPLEKYYYFAPHRFPAKQWGNLTGKFLGHGMTVATENSRPGYRGSGIATAYLSARTACVREALPGENAAQIIEVLRQSALTPVPEIGYA